jgi:excisionase family DNA binding protein
MKSQESAKPPIALSIEDQRQILDLYQQMQRSRARLVGPDGKSRSLPDSLHDFLVHLIADLIAGRSVSIMQNAAQLTTVEAARMLGVSRQFLIKLLDSGSIPHHLVGTHRRIYARDLLNYKARRDTERRRILDELSRAEAADGLYDLEPPPDDQRTR